MGITERDVMIGEALRVRFAIVRAGGMATKSAVESALMYIFGIERDEAHGIMNEIEARNLEYGKAPYLFFDSAVHINEYKDALNGVHIQWFNGNPF